MAFLYRNGFEIVHNHNKQYEMCQKLTSTNSLQVTHIEFDSMLNKVFSNVHLYRFVILILEILRLFFIFLIFLFPISL